MPDLSIIIPSRNEMFLARTIQDILQHMEGDTEIIAVLDGAWADPRIPDHPRVRLTHSATVIGQRAATNLGARMSSARYVMKCDAHVSFDQGFDVKLMAADEEIGRPDLTQIPAQFNLHVFNWKCNDCGHETYQGPLPVVCEKCEAKKAPSSFTRVVYWDLNAGGIPGRPNRTEFWRFDHDMHFQYWNSTRDAKGKKTPGYHKRPEAQGDLVDVMSSIGACFFMRRERFWRIGGLDTNHGSWGNFGSEIACKSWLSGGRQIVNKRTWYAHMFRTREGFTFPYPMKGSDQEKARIYSRDLWLNNKWPGQTLPLSWLVEKFSPVPGWCDPEGKARLAEVQAAGVAFMRGRGHADRTAGDPAVSERREVSVVPVPISGLADAAPVAAAVEHQPALGLTKGLVYYSDCRGDAQILSCVRQQIQRCANGHRIVSATLQPLDFGHQNLVLNLERGQLAMFKQILAGLEALDTDVAFLVEHDCLYHPSHFDFTPPTADRFFYNQNRWQVSAEDGRAVHYRASQTSGCCASRTLLVEHYRKRIAYIEAHGWNRNYGYEPGTNSWSKSIDPHGAETWMSPFPNLDLRHGHNLSKTRWSPSEFRDKRTCEGWTESDEIPGWGTPRGRFREFLTEVTQS